MNSRIWIPFYIFFLNPVYVAARSLRSLRSNHQSSSSPISMPKSFSSYLLEKLFFPEKSCIRLSWNWRNELDKGTTLVYPYFLVWFKSLNATILVFYEERNLGIRDSHVIKLMANDWKEWISLLITHCSHFHFSFFFSFRTHTSLFLFDLIFDYIFSHNYYNYSMFQKVPGCSGMCHVPGFIDAHDTKPDELKIIFIVQLHWHRTNNAPIVHRLQANKSCV